MVLSHLTKIAMIYIKFVIKIGNDTIEKTIPRIRNSVEIAGFLNKFHFVFVFL